MIHTPPVIPEAHFITRARQRGFGADAAALYADLCLALQRLRRGEDRDGDYVEHLFCLPGSKFAVLELMRFRVRSGRIAFVLVANDLRPITVLTPEMVEYYKARRAKRSKNVVRGKRRERIIRED